MPHLVIERFRLFPDFLTSPRSTGRLESRTENAKAGAYLLEAAGAAASCIFIAGSICFVPQYADNIATLFAGCMLFIIGSVIYCFICTVTLSEALLRRCSNYEIWENAMYLAGSALYVVGSVLYLPARVDIIEMSMMSISLSQVCALSSIKDRQYYGTVLFIVGSFLFVVAAFVNALNPRRADETSSRLVTGTTSCYMIGSLLFAVGSVTFLPRFGCTPDLLALGAWCFIWGSAFFLLGDILSFCRVIHHYNSIVDKGSDQRSLLA
ncbi:unnamed protein product [Prorocentrum cordatum]|uniref:YrhK domain-containing protein n=1 Tax=Prorocentrum cordatum TaxID=2364126 RepID=A0ABN9SPD4_9DINO|nr:unnamed protein product [Polarella glacialis]|mmetsp:Transcript_87762/g.237966  ORF Transcript_87762/g.237966 Transcript_87762/m.237966 type:complete len:266 (+) Transcript_87762:89-886(+)